MKINQITYSALLLAILIICSKISISLGWIPITMQTLAVILIALLTTTHQAAYIYLVYIIMGLFGLPVFSGQTAGPAVILTPSFGFVLAFFPMTYFIQKIELHYPKWPKFFSLFLGHIILYGLGIAYMSIILTQVMKMDTTLIGLLEMGLFPFIIGDIIKTFFAVKIHRLVAYFIPREAML